MQGLRKLFSRRRRYDDISVSIQEHIEERTEELMAEGMPRKEAEQAARREFGNVTLLQERSREEWQWAALESILADLKLTLRRLRKSPGFAITVLLTIALGIGANTTVFSVINSVLLKPLRYPDSSRLAALTLNAPGAEGMADFSTGLQAFAVDVSDFFRAQPDIPVVGCLDDGHGKRDRGCSAGRGAHSARQWRRAGDARRPSQGRPVVLAG